MSDTEAPKPSRMSGLIAPKGSAPRPAEASPKSPEPSITAPTAIPSAAVPSKSLTLRLPEVEYERLRAYAFVNRKSHQTVMAEALKAYLDAMT